MRTCKLIVAAIIVAAAFGTLAPAPASADFDPLCTWTKTTAPPVEVPGPNSGVLTAGPYIVLGASSVDVTCELRFDGPTGAVFFTNTQSTPGQIGVYAAAWSFHLPSAGRSIFVCTYTKGNPAGVTLARGCNYAFTSRV
jgi:hypothetical protein